MRERHRNEASAYPGQKARQGEIILRTPLQRAIFVGGLAGIVVLVLVLYAVG
jgi:hypothetical protein